MLMFIRSIRFQLLVLLILSADIMSKQKLLSVNFEVFGVVQGVFFRKYTQEKAKSLGLKGFCMNTHSGTVQGRMQGPPDKIEEMKSWLQKVGSPSSKIDKAVFNNEEEINDYTDKDFVIRR